MFLVMSLPIVYHTLLYMLLYTLVKWIFVILVACKVVRGQRVRVVRFMIKILLLLHFDNYQVARTKIENKPEFPISCLQA